MQIRCAEPARLACVAFALAALVLARPARADTDAPRLRYATAGPALSAGVGTQYGGSIGVALGYFLPIAPRPLSLFAGLGWGGENVYDAAGTVDERDLWVTGASFTLGASYGHRHRLCAAIGYGIATSQAIAIEGLIIDAVARYGFSGELGYEFVGQSGVFVRLLPLGLRYIPHAVVPAREWRTYSFTLGVGWKPW